MNSDRRLSLLGLAKRAGKVTDGEGRVIDIMKHASNGIVFLASDAGDNIKKKIRDKAATYAITIVEDFDTDALSKAIGKINRKVLAVTDPGFVKQLKG